MTSLDKAALVLSGTVTDGKGSRNATVTIQTPGNFRFEESGGGRVLTFDGTTFMGKGGSGDIVDERIRQSLLANFPDALLLQIAGGGGLRRIGSRFRTDGGKSRVYTGPYWTLYAFSPAKRERLVQGQALQQAMFIALDEQTGLLSETRAVDTTQYGRKTVIQTSSISGFSRRTSGTQVKFCDWRTGWRCCDSPSRRRERGPSKVRVYSDRDGSKRKCRCKPGSERR